MSKNTNSGFTLIELMVVLAIIGMILIFAVPAYQNYLIRARIAEGLTLALAPKVEISTTVSSVQDLGQFATEFNTQAGGKGSTSKYVDSIQVNGLTGVITIVFNSATTGLSGTENILTLTPWVRYDSNGESLSAALAAGHTGIVDWGCSSLSANTATGENIAVSVMGTMLPQFAPAQCR